MDKNLDLIAKMDSLRVKKKIESQEEQIQLLIYENKQYERINMKVKRELAAANEKNKELENIIKQKEKYIELLKIISHNERGAGRKPKTTEEQREIILKLREHGITYKKIAKKMNLSVGTVYNIVRDNS